MEEFLSHNMQHLEILGIVAGTLTTIYIFYIKVLKAPVCKFCESVERIYMLPSRIEHIFNELQENSGKSLKDTIKRLEETQILLINKHKILMDDYPLGIVETDAEGRITWANATYLEYVDLDLRDVLGNGWINAVEPTSRQRIYDSWQAAIEQQRMFNEHFILEINGKRVEVQGVAYPIRANEIIKGYIGKIKLLMDEQS